MIVLQELCQGFRLQKRMDQAKNSRVSIRPDPCLSEERDVCFELGSDKTICFKISYMYDYFFQDLPSAKLPKERGINPYLKKKF